MTTDLSDFESRVMSALNMATGGVSVSGGFTDDLLGLGASSSGVQVSVSKALSLPAVWNSVFRIAGHIGMLPVEIRRPLDPERNTSALMPLHPAARVLNGPNPKQTGQIFRETLMANALLSGNGKAVIQRNVLGQPIELLLIPPEYSYTMMWEAEKWHIINLPNHYTGNELGGYSSGNAGPPNGWYKFADDEIFHIPGLSYDGLWGIDVIRNSRDVFGIALAGQDSAGFSFRNNGRPGLLLEAPRNVLTTAKQSKEFLDQFNEMHQGLDKAGKTGLIREGMKAHILPSSAADSEFTDSRNFSRQDIALLFGTESVMGEGAAVYKDRQDRMVAYIQNCLARWFCRWNHEAQRKLLSDRDRASGVFLKFDTRALITGDPATQSSYTRELMSQGIATINEARSIHGMSPIEGGDELPKTAPEPSSDAEPPDAESDDDIDDDASDDDSSVQDVARIAVGKVFSAFIATEQQRVKAAVKRDDSEERLDKFYHHHLKAMVSACESLGLPVSLAESHCGISRRAIASEPPAMIADVVANWKTRHKEFSDAV